MSKMPDNQAACICGTAILDVIIMATGLVLGILGTQYGFIPPTAAWGLIGAFGFLSASFIVLCINNCIRLSSGTLKLG